MQYGRRIVAALVILELWYYDIQGMEKFDRSKTVKNQKVPKGTILLLQGESLRSINFLHSGMAELLSFSRSVDKLKPDDIINQSHRVGLIKGDSVFGLMGFQSDTAYDKSVRALTDCIVSIPERTKE